MCLAFPGKVKSLGGDFADVDFDGVEKRINVSLVDAEKGDYVVVHAGFAIEKLDKNEAQESIKLFKEGNA